MLCEFVLARRLAFMTNTKDNTNMMYIMYLDLPTRAEWMIRNAGTPSLRIQTAPFGKILVYFFFFHHHW